MIQSVWKLISLLIGLVVFLGVGLVLWLAGEDLIWIVAKSISAFFVCWIVLCQLGGMLAAVLKNSTQQNEEEAESQES
jgi:ABC-type bacteriocin/lantibiotic exporter with double-glycine peptidase domain